MLTANIFFTNSAPFGIEISGSGGLLDLCSPAMCILQEQAFYWVNLSPFHLKYRIAPNHLAHSQALQGPSQHVVASGLSTKSTVAGRACLCHAPYVTLAMTAYGASLGPTPGKGDRKKPRIWQAL